MVQPFGSLRCQVWLHHWEESHGTEQPGRFEGPEGRFDLAVMDRDDIDFLHDFPIDATPIEVPDAIGRQVCHFNFQGVLAWMEIFADPQPHGQCDDHAGILAVDSHPRTFADFAQIE